MSFLGETRGLAAAICIAAAIGAGPALAQKSADTLRVATSEPTSSLDYYMGAERMNIIMSHHLYDTLIYKNIKTGEFEPALAEKFSYVDDKTLEFVIRKGVKFHNGELLTADDVVYTLNTVSDPSFGALYKIAVQWIDRAEKVSDNTVRLHMKEASPVALEWLAGFVPIYSKAYYEKVGPKGMATAPIGTGPYRLASIDPGTRWVLKRFDEYFEGSPKGNKIGTIDIRVMPEINTQLTELLTHRVDFMWGFTPDVAERMKNRPRVSVENVPILRINYMLVNTQMDSPLKDIRVRKAIVHALNRKEIKDTFVGPGAQVIDSACNPVQFGCEADVARYPYDPAEARRLLAEAGYPNGFKLPLLLSINTTLPRPVQEALLANLSAVGIELELTSLNWAAAREAWVGGKYPLLLMSWGSWGISDVAMMTSEFFNGREVDLVKDKEVVEAINAADRQSDRERRRKLYSDAIKRVAENAYFVPLWTFNVNYAQSSDLNFSVDPDEIVRFFNATWK